MIFALFALLIAFVFFVCSLLRVRQDPRGGDGDLAQLLQCVTARGSQTDPRHRVIEGSDRRGGCAQATASSPIRFGSLADNSRLACPPYPRKKTHETAVVGDCDAPRGFMPSESTLLPSRLEQGFAAHQCQRVCEVSSNTKALPVPHRCNPSSKSPVDWDTENEFRSPSQRRRWFPA